MPETPNTKNLLKNLIGFVETKLELIKLDLKDQLSDVLSKILVLIMIIFLVFTGIIFGSLTLASYLNQLFSSNFIGYSIVTLIYIVLIVIVYLIKDSKRLHNMVYQKLRKYLS